MSKRVASIERNTSETQIALSLNIDGSGNYKNETPVPFLNHMLDLFAKHALVDLEIKATGDVEVDYRVGNLVEQGFIFKRLKYEHVCGCGESFTPVKDLPADGKQKLGWT